jgi:hypothetical protein
VLHEVLQNDEEVSLIVLLLEDNKVKVKIHYDVYRKTVVH